MSKNVDKKVAVYKQDLTARKDESQGASLDTPRIVPLGSVVKITGNSKGRQYRDGNKDSERQ